MSANTNRKRRQVAAISSDICEPRFISLKDDDATFKLIWACPDDGINNDTDTYNIPSPEIQELICETLLDKKIVTDCIYTNGESAVITVQALQPIEYVVAKCYSVSWSTFHTGYWCHSSCSIRILTYPYLVQKQSKYWETCKH